MYITTYNDGNDGILNNKSKQKYFRITKTHPFVNVKETIKKINN